MTRTSVTRLLERVEGGDRAALDELFVRLYHEIRELAHRQRRRWYGDDTLGTTAIVHEAYLKLIGQARIGVESRAHFLALAARAMRHILCNYARDRQATKRGGRLRRLSLDQDEPLPDPASPPAAEDDSLAAVDLALRRLEQVDPRLGKVVECRFFGGLTIEETAAVLGISARTVRRDWTIAQAWLHRELRGSA